ncbi:flagellar hook-associated protein FlgK [uncultured Aquitalea sp.]|uniref:flagellar hook-associated protein FlgK n=1 Tax=uncultured Aquitalea sp. TaxID=540272 RepID=UPI0025DD277D|nr:flagellar hook-associated protein FlgK [uncultured Aquitalea sp.]
MGTNIFSIGVSGLNAAQTALSVIGHNISNVNTAGYNRQIFTQAARLPQQEGFGYLGKGVDITGVTRTYNQYLDGQVLTAQASGNYYSTQVQQLNQINNLLSDPSIGLSSSFTSFFNSLQTLSQDPSSIPSRQTVINMGQALVSNFTTIGNNLQTMQSNINSQISTTVDGINSLATQIANLNQQIAAATGGNATQPPNDLMDQRDNAMEQLNKLVPAKAVVQSDGTYSVFIGSGQALVLSNVAYKLATQNDPANPTNQQVVYPNASGTNTVLANNLFGGGQLGGLLDFRDGALLQTQKKLGTLAIDFTTAMNYQNSLGRDLSGQQGGNVFGDLTSYASHPQDVLGNMQMVLNDPTKLAASSSLKLASGGITPTPNSVTLSGVWATVPSTYGWANSSTPPSTATHPATGLTSLTINATSATSISATVAGTNPGTYNVVPDPTVSNGYKLVDSATPPNDVGISFQLSGQLSAGTTINVGTVPTGTVTPGNSNNLGEMLKLQTKPIVDETKNGTHSGLQSFQTYYSTTVSYVGNVTNSAQLSSAAQTTVLQQATTARSNSSGVNLDEEAANLIKYQQAYQASGKVISLAQTLFQQILQMGG